MSADPWLVVVDMQTAFSAPSSEWGTEDYGSIVPTVKGLVDRYAGRTVFTRFVRDPAESGQWSAYYDRWPAFRVSPDDPVWDLTVPVPSGTPVIEEPTFSKWTPRLQQIVGSGPMVMCGVATECCVLATALAAADAGRRVQVVADACAGATRSLHDQALRIMDTMAPLLSVVTSEELRSQA